MKKKEVTQNLNLDIIAGNYVCAHTLHLQALERSSLAYIDKLMDALLTSPRRTVREVANDLLDMVPDLSEGDASCLARTKFLGVGLDSEAA